MLDEEHLRFARQCGATDVVVHLVDYFHQPTDEQGVSNQPVEKPGGYWGVAGANAHLWELDSLMEIRERIEAQGLRWYAVENLDPALWHDILLDGPEKETQMANIRRLLGNLGEAGISVLGYNFSLAGVYGRVKGPYARGQAESVGMEGVVDEEPMPDGVVWNMVYDASRSGPCERSQISSDVLWDRLATFLNGVLSAAEEAGVALALHPDDPPVERLRNTPRLVNRPELYRRLLEINPSPSNQLEYCLGTLSEMPSGELDIYEATAEFAKQDRIAYIHLRNVMGKAPHYREVFIDEGDIDVKRIFAILKEQAFEGVIIPDHTPLMSCAAPWHAGMAYAMGYLRALL